MSDKPETVDLAYIGRLVAAFEATTSSLSERAASAEKRADWAETRADRAEQALAGERSRADRAEAARDVERAGADALRDRLHGMQEQLADAHAALQAAAKAEARAERAERGKEQIEQGRETAEARADELRDRLDDLGAKLTGAQAELAAVQGLHRELEATQARIAQVEQGRETAEARAYDLRTQRDELQVQFAAQQELIDASEAIRQAEAERRGRGFLARLSAALRGE
jgi:chromosome segregation ATPase